MAQINKPSDYFNTVLYTGDGTTSNAITGVGFQPDLVWLKNRSAIAGHHLSDVVRGKSGTNYLTLSTDTTTAEVAQGDNDGVNTLGIDGFTVGYTNSTAWNNSGNNYVSWNWLGGGTASSNTDGSITSSVSANTTSGFSIVSYTGTGANATVGHGLGVAPSMVIVKIRSAAGENWQCFHQSLGGTKYINLNNTNAADVASNIWQDTSPTSSVFSIGTHGSVNTSSATYIAYCFAEKKGFSKIGSYTGNGSLDGTFVYTGFKPAWVMIKRTDAINSWIMYDNKRVGTYGLAGNVIARHLFANTSDVEDSAENYNWIDFYSNGFKLREDGSTDNASGGSYIYMAFAENPLVGTNNVPACAR